MSLQSHCAMDIRQVLMCVNLQTSPYATIGHASAFSDPGAATWCHLQFTWDAEITLKALPGSHRQFTWDSEITLKALPVWPYSQTHQLDPQARPTNSYRDTSPAYRRTLWQ